MSCSGNNTLAIGRPSKSGMGSASCSSSCSNLGPVDPLNKAQLGPRPKREKVREQIKEYIYHMLGAPVNPLEFDEQNVDFCVDQALMIFEEYAGDEYFQYYKFNTTPGQSVYTMPPDIGMIKEVSYNQDNNFAFNSSDLGGSIPIEYFWDNGSYIFNGGMINPTQPIYGRMGEWFVFKSYLEMFNRLSSNKGGWEFLGGTDTIKLFPVPCGVRPVAVKYIQKNKDWSEVKQAMQEGALSYAKEILGRIRGRIKNIPGPNGGIQLDGDQLLQEAKEEREKWMENLLYKFSTPFGPSWG